MVTRISGAFLAAFLLYVVGGAVFLPAADTAVVGAQGGTGITLLGALGIAWYFAVWASLVAAMVFLIAWTGARFEDVAAESQAEAQPPSVAITPAATAEPRRKELARAG